MRLLGIHSKRTVKAYNRCANILAPEIEVDRDAKIEDCDGVFIHNTLVCPKTDKPMILYLCSGSVVNVCCREEAARWILRRPNIIVWTNCSTATDRLREHGIKSTVMYRPGVLHTPKKCPAMPKERRILWYWIKNDAFFKEVDDQYIAVARTLGDTEIWVIPSAKPFAKLPNVKALGYVRMGKVLPQVHGMVRASRCPDFGRSMFDVLSFGRWVWTTGMSESHVETTSMDNLAAEIRARIDKGEANVKGYEWMRNGMNEVALHKRWVNTARKAILR